MGRRRHRALGGFTLIELLVCVTVLAVLVRLAVPSFASAMLTNRLSSYTNNFVGSAQLARSEAVKRNATLTLCASADGATCASCGTWAQGWIVMCPSAPANPAMCSSGGTSTLVLQTQPAISSDFHFTSGFGNYSLAFPATGVGVTQQTLTLCRWAPQAGNQERQLTFAATGRTAVVTTRAGVCP